MVNTISVAGLLTAVSETTEIGPTDSFEIFGAANLVYVAISKPESVVEYRFEIVNGKLFPFTVSSLTIPQRNARISGVINVFGLSQTTVAKLFGVSQSLVNNVARARRRS